MLKVTTTSEKETQALAAKFSHKLRGGQVLALQGNLGSGKTTFVQGLARGLGIQKKITSPSFVILKLYPIPRRSLVLAHVDLYRLKNPLAEFRALGGEELLRDPKKIVAIEWPEKIFRLLRYGTIKIRFSPTRKISERVLTWTAK